MVLAFREPQQKGIQGTVMRIEASVKTHVSIRSQYGDFSNMNKELSMNHQDSRKNNEDQKMGCIWFKTIKTIKSIINIKHLISIDIWYPSSNQPTHSFFSLVSPFHHFLGHRTIASSFQQETTPQLGVADDLKKSRDSIWFNPQQWDWNNKFKTYLEKNSNIP